MSRRQKDPLRASSAEERAALTRLSCSQSAPAAQGARATALLAVADGQSCLAAARQAGRCDTETVAAWVARFTRAGLAAAMPRHGGGPPIGYGAAAHRRLREDARRAPDRARDGTALWSLSTLQCALRRAEDGRPRVSPDTIWQTLHAAGLSGQQSRTWCATGMAGRTRKPGGAVVVRDPEAAGTKP